jgi:hypothetical protein
MEKQYVMKMGVFYLSKYFINSEKIETNFVDSLIFTTSIDTALKLGIDKAKYLDKILYIESGIDFEIKEVER